MLQELNKKIQEKNARIAVIGLGYVGLPVACEFARVGFSVLGVDILEDRIQMINQGISPIKGNEPGLEELLGQVIKQDNFRASTDYQDLVDQDIILIDVETPVDEDNKPKYTALRSVLRELGPVLKTGALVIVESTIAPLTMKDLVLPLLEKSSGKEVNNGFFLGNCPERVMPGKLLQNLRNISRVVGGMSPETAETMINLYQHVVDAALDPVDSITAELVKTTENAFRDVNIAFANEVAKICEVVGGDVWIVRELVNKSPGRNMHIPGAGVGGHCIPKDPWLLIANLADSYIPRLIPIAREINDSMPLHMAELTMTALSNAGVEIKDARIAILGYAYLENSDDTRNSPSEILVRYFLEQGAEVVIHDPFIKEYRRNIHEMIKGCHAVVLMVKHNEYLTLDIDKIGNTLEKPIIIDGRNILDTREFPPTDIVYRGIGR